MYKWGIYIFHNTFVIFFCFFLLIKIIFSTDCTLIISLLSSSSFFENKHFIPFFFFFFKNSLCYFFERFINPLLFIAEVKEYKQLYLSINHATSASSISLSYNNHILLVQLCKVFFFVYSDIGIPFHHSFNILKRTSGLLKN